MLLEPSLDTVILSRIQFAFTIAFHIIFPTLNLGLAVFLTLMEAQWLRTKNDFYLQTCRFWSKIFALTFGMGVVSGIVMSYELGTNFAHFTQAVGGVLGPLFGYEVLTAFFLEAGFLGVMLFGWTRVTPRLHFFATLLVTIGTTISAFWIMSANSWMHSPAGYVISGDHYVVASWLQVIFNPLFIVRLLHMLLAAYVTCSFIILGISAWYLLKNKQHLYAQRWLRIALFSALIVTPLQIGMGDWVGVKVYEHQPIKTAAMEGLWETTHGAPVVLFGWPDVKQEKNLYEIKIPKLASFLNTHDWNGEMVGLSSVAPQDRPNVVAVFYTFRIMVGIGFLMLFVALTGLLLYWRKTIDSAKNYLRVCVLIAPLGLVATIMGWMTSEMGRQPWVVQHLLRTVDAVSAVDAYKVMLSLGLFVVVYGIIFSFYLYYVFKIIRKGADQNTLLLHQPIETKESLFTYMPSEGKPTSDA